MTFVPDLYLSKFEVFLSRLSQVYPQTLKPHFLFLAVYPYPFYGLCYKHQSPVKQIRHCGHCCQDTTGILPVVFGFQVRLKGRLISHERKQSLYLKSTLKVWTSPLFIVKSFL